MPRRAVTFASVLSILALIAAVYWPVHRAGFVWDDKIAFEDAAWLRHGNDWLMYLLRGMSGWINYFRPLGVAFFTLQVRLFDVSPMPMHLVSLGLHLANTCLLGLLAHKLTPQTGLPARRIAAIGTAMLLYGLHPALVEPVVWISCQYDLIVTLLVLLALYANVSLQRTLARTCVVAGCFFLAACAKESAIALPVLVLIFDAATAAPADNARHKWTGTIWRRQRFVYVGLLLAGLAYLAARHAALGYLARPFAPESLFTFARFQEVCYTYLMYWRIGVWPMIGGGPLHVVDGHAFAYATGTSIATDIAALTIVATGLVLAWKRRPLGCLILAYSAALLAVLHIVPIAFVESAYHERYAMMALAVALAWLPKVVLDAGFPSHPAALWKSAITVVVVWLILAIANIRVTLPLWSDELRLWQWALQQDPESVIARDHLLSEYIRRDDREQARALADSLLAQHTSCANCLLNIAFLACADRDVARAALALDRLGRNKALAYDSRLFQGFVLATGQVRELRGDAKGAEQAYRDAIALAPLDPLAHMNLAILLAQEGKITQARQAIAATLPLFAPDQRDARRIEFERALATHRGLQQ